MIKKITAILILVLLIIPYITACGASKDGILTGGQSYTDYIDTGKRFAVQIGDVYSDLSRELFKAKTVQEYTTVADMLEALRTNRVDAVLLSHGVIKQLQDSGSYPDFEYLWVPKDVYAQEAGPVFHTEELRDKYNEWLSGIAADGTWQKILDRWIGVPLPSQEEIPVFEFTGENGILRVCDTGNYPPMIYFDENGTPTGLDVEMISLFAQYMGMKPEFDMMSYDAVVPYVVSGKADMSACMLTQTDERSESMIFGEPFCITQAVLIVPKSTEASAGTQSEKVYSDFFGKTIGIPAGYIFDVMIEEEFKGTVAYYSQTSAGIEDVRHGRISGFMTDFSIAGVICNQPGNEDMQVISVPFEMFSGLLGAVSKKQDIVDRFNAFLAEIKADGLLGEMQRRWIEEDPGSDPPMTDIPLTGENGVLKVAVGDGSIPFCYVGANGELKGYCVELILRFAAREGMTVDFAPMEFSAVLTYTTSGKADIGIDAITITEERKKSLLFTDSIYDDRAGIIALKQTDSKDALDYTDFIGKKFAVKNGTIYDSISTDAMKSSETLLFEDYPSVYEAILKGRADAGMRGYYAAYVSMFEAEYSGLAITALPEGMQNNPIAAISMDQQMIDAFNEFLSVIKSDGTYDDMKNRWFDTFDPGQIPVMPDIPLTGENGVLTVAISSDYMPFSFLGENGVNLGFDIELARRFAAYLGKDIEFVDMAFSGLLPYITSGKADIAVYDITITEERKKSVLFTDSYFTDLSAIIYKKDIGTAVKTGFNFIEWVKTGAERNLITDGRWKMVVNGLGVTMVIALMSQIFGTVFGCFVCWLLTRKNRFVKWIGNLYCGFIHGTPIVVFLMITYYIIFGNTNISNILVAVVAFSLVTGAGIAGNLKGAIDTVDPVEIEAARSLGFSAFKAFLTVTLPQAVRRALPGYTNGFVELVKATAIVGYIAIQDLTRAGDIIRSRTYDAYFPLLFIAAIYLIITTICVQIFKLIVQKANGGKS